MSPRDLNILNTLNVLVLVFRTHKQIHPDLNEEEKHVIKITKEHLAGAELTIPIFINTLHELDKKGYLMAVTVFEDKYRSEIHKFLDPTEYLKITDALQQVDTTELIEKIKIAVADTLERTMPQNVRTNREEVLNEKLDIKSLLDSGKTIFEEFTPDTIASIVLSPFRSIEQLLEKMNEGTRFDDVKDAGVWYDSDAYEFHFDELTVSTTYNHKPNKEHFALKALFNKFGESSIDYDTIPEFDLNNPDKEMRAYRDALNRLLKKHPRLAEIFTVHSDHFAIHEGYLEHPH